MWRVSEQRIPDKAASQGCGWSSSLNLAVKDSWASGSYLVRIKNSDGATAEAFFVVRAGEPADAILVLATSTWAAYNDWGGPSFHTGGHCSSLRRPLPGGFLDKPDPHRFRVARLADLPRAEVQQHFDTYSL